MDADHADIADNANVVQRRLPLSEPIFEWVTTEKRMPRTRAHRFATLFPIREICEIRVIQMGFRL